jgi:precorrin-6B C5,15-methyltransferase / cobalt-precorrin-6B C5,C15-methyltransferase
MSEPRWLTLIGIGDNGLESLSRQALTLLLASKVVVVSERLVGVIGEIGAPGEASSSPLGGEGGAERRMRGSGSHVSPLLPPSSPRIRSALLPQGEKRALSPVDSPLDNGQTILNWADGYRETLERILALRGTPVTVLATGDPMHFGIGSTLLKHIGAEEMLVLPSPSAFSLAAARLGWPLQNVAQISLHGRPVEALNRYLFPSSRILALTSDASTVAAICARLVARGFGGSLVHVLEHMGGAGERITHMSAQAIVQDRLQFADFNTVGIDCVADHNARYFSPVSGLPDDAFMHDGQLTKREVRAATLSYLQPMPGQLLWDVGAGCGSVGLEWMRSAPQAQAIAIESQAARLEMIAANARALGFPELVIVAGEAPDALQGLAAPDAVFIGGGVTGEGVFEACWQALKPGGRLVANVVTLEGEARLTGLRAEFGGEMTRISVARAAPVGRYCGWKSLMPVTLWSVVKGQG